jgi:autophagy-related protein 5
LKWHLPAGLLYDLYSGTSGHSQDNNGRGDNHLTQDEEDQLAKSIPWRLTLHFSEWPSEQLSKLDAEGMVLRDAFTNSYKEASFIRHGSNRVVMSLSKDDATQLWQSVEQHNLQLFDQVNKKLLHPPGVALRSIPLKVYLPSAALGDSTSTPAQGHLKVVQSLVLPHVSSRQPQTLGTALNNLLPTLFPSRRSPLLAIPVLHGAVVPLGVGLEELAETASYADGFIHLAVVMMG